jgi:hypothetical protein
MTASRTRALMILGVLMLASSFQGTAQAASWTYSNGFESTSGWGFWGQGDHDGATYYGPQYAHSGDHYAGLTTHAAGAFSTVYRTVNVPYPNPIGRSSVACTVSVWAKADFSSAKIWVEVIDPAAWVYVALNSFIVKGPYNGSYTRIGASWTAARRDVLVRFWAEDSVMVDDLKVTCNYS